MMEYLKGGNSFTRLVEELMELPGVGEKTAMRFALYILRSPVEYVERLTEVIGNARTKVNFCKFCRDITEGDLCRICRDERRDSTLVCVVEGPAGVSAMERTDQYRGRYHVLHGNLSPLSSIGPAELQFDRLKERIVSSSQIAEVILALDSDPEGEATALYLKEYLQELPVKVTRIAAGMPVGSYVEYMDPITLSRALTSRCEIRQ